MEQVYQMNGYKLHVIHTKKFKTNMISIKFQNHLTRETATQRKLLSLMLNMATSSLTSQKEITRFLEEHYGASLNTSVSTKGEASILSVSSMFINDHYIPGKGALLGDILQLLNDVFYAPYVFENAFNDKILKLRKKELVERIESLKDDKFSYALDRTFEMMGEGNPLEITSMGYVDDIKNIDGKDLYQYLLECLENDKKDVYFVGDFDESYLELFNQHLSFPRNNNEYRSYYIFSNQRDYPQEIIEIQDITQAKLSLGYKVDCDRLSREYYAMVVLNAIFGGFSESQLFQVVREQHSLCYYIHSSYDAYNSVMVVVSAIESNNYKQTVALIEQELNKLKDGQISHDLISLAKNMLIASLEKSVDSPSTLLAMNYANELIHRDESIEEYINHIQSVTKEEMIKAAQSIELDTIFLLAGKDYNENN